MGEAPAATQADRDRASRIATMFLGNDDSLAHDLSSGQLDRHWLLDELANVRRDVIEECAQVADRLGGNRRATVREGNDREARFLSANRAQHVRAAGIAKVIRLLKKGPLSIVGGDEQAKISDLYDALRARGCIDPIIFKAMVEAQIGEGRPYPTIQAAADHYGLSRDQLRAFLRGKRPAEPRLLEAFGLERVVLYASKTGGEGHG